MDSIDSEEDSSLIEQYEAYVLENHRVDILDILQQPDATEHCSLVINLMSLMANNMDAADRILTDPENSLAAFDVALCRAQKVVLDSVPAADRSDLDLKPHLHARVTGLPVCPDLTRTTLPRTSDIGNFLSITGTVIRASTVKMLEMEKDFLCNQCKHVFSVVSDFQQFFTVCRPSKCPNNECGNMANFTALNDKGSGPSSCRNYQELKIQEQVQQLAVGTIPRSMWVTLQDDLVDCCKPGDDVTICGTVLRRWRTLYHGTRCDLELVLRANYVKVMNEDRAGILLTQEKRDEFAAFWERHKYSPMKGRNHILSSLCPQVYGLYVVKLAVALILTGGVQRIDDSGTRVRGESHLLLVGDPGTGKSQFLKYAAKVTPRSVLTTGIGSTSAGLTVTAVKDGGEWQLEAGALVLSDGGICCIDEFNSIREADKTSIHEAMEQQTISVAKAGLVCKLNSRCTILAATNPKGAFDPEQSLSVNVCLGSPLLSRFDLVLVLLDQQNELWDTVVSSYILDGKNPMDGLGQGDDSVWTMEEMQAYISMIKTINPTLTAQASSVLGAYYKAQRQADSRNAARTTMRLLESIIRLSQAHARLMMHREVTVQDAVVAVSVIESSMQGAALLGGVNVLHTSFPEDAEAEYRVQADLILSRLALYNLRQAEMQRLDELDSNRALYTPSQGFTSNQPISQPASTFQGGGSDSAANDKNLPAPEEELPSNLSWLPNAADDSHVAANDSLLEDVPWSPILRKREKNLQKLPPQPPEVPQSDLFQCRSSSQDKDPSCRSSTSTAPSERPVQTPKDTRTENAVGSLEEKSLQDVSANAEKGPFVRERTDSRKKDLLDDIEADFASQEKNVSVHKPPASKFRFSKKATQQSHVCSQNGAPTRSDSKRSRDSSGDKPSFKKKAKNLLSSPKENTLTMDKISPETPKSTPSTPALSVSTLSKLNRFAFKESPRTNSKLESPDSHKEEESKPTTPATKPNFKLLNLCQRLKPSTSSASSLPVPSSISPNPAAKPSSSDGNRKLLEQKAQALISPALSSNSLFSIGDDGEDLDLDL